MTRPRQAGSPAVSQFQLIGGIRHDAGDCLAAIAPGGSVQERKGALYIVTEPAGDPATGGEACGLAHATLAHEYYADPSPSLTTSLSVALNRANTSLIAYNRKVLAAGDPPAGRPRKIRVGLSAAVVRPGRLYLCQLKPGLILWLHGGVIHAYPRPITWSPLGATLNGDGEPVGSFYPAPALGTTPLVEADFAFRRFDSGDLLLLCSSTLAPLLNEEALAAALPGHSAAAAIEYLYNLAQQAGLPEAHALAVEMADTPAPRRGSGPITLPPPPPWAPAAEVLPMPPPPGSPPAVTYKPAPAAGVPFAAPVASTRPATPLPAPAHPTDEDTAQPLAGTARILHLRPRHSAATAPADSDPAGSQAATVALPAQAAIPGDESAAAAPFPSADSDPLPAAAGSPVPSVLTNVLARARTLGRRAAPLMGAAGKATMGAAGAAGKATLGAAGAAGKATLGAAGSAGKATLGAAGAVLGSTLPENVRQRGAAGILHPDGQLIIEEGDPADEYEDEPDEGTSAAAPPAEGALSNRVIDFDAPGHAAPAPPPPFPLLRLLVPVAVVVVLGVLLFAIQSVLAGQQNTKVDSLLLQAQQAEADSHSGPVADQRNNLLKAFELVQQAQQADPRSAKAGLLAALVQSQMDKLNGVIRLAGLRLLADLDRPAAPPGNPGSTDPPATARTGTAGGAALPTGSPADSLGAPGTPISDTGTLTALPAPVSGSDYFSNVLVQGQDAFLLNQGTGTLYRLALSTTVLSPLLTPGDRVDLVGSVDGKARVAPLIAIAWRPTAEGGDLAALDDAHTAYIWTPATGVWQAFALGGAAGLGKPRDMGAYDGNLYLLWAKPGQISKWSAGAYSNPPTDWLSAAAGNELRSRNPLGMAIDGTIHLLLVDGRITTLAAGEVQSTIALPVWPTLSSPLALFTNEANASIYLVEKADKRIIRVDKATGALQGQLKAPIGDSTFDNLRNIYVDEAAAKLYVLSGKKLYLATLPALPTAAGTAVPALPAAAPSATVAPARTGTP